MSKIPLDRRWQLVPWYVKAYRVCRHAPPLIVHAAWKYLEWAVVYRLCIPNEPQGFYRSRWHVAIHAFERWRAMLDIAVGRYLTAEEAMNELRKSSRAT